jgi:hypothetical protein
MNFQTANGVAVNPQNRFATVSLPFPTPARNAARRPICKGNIRAAPFLRARPSCPRPNHSPNGSTHSTLSLIAKKVLCPCLAAVVIAKVLAYVVQFCAFILLLLR